MRSALDWPPGGGGVAPPRIVEQVAAAAARAGRDPRASVDAGAHMFSATAFWPCSRPRDLLISNGLASMGFALPAGIAAALHDPARGAVAFTGDGGLMMCLAELATAAECGARVVTVVFNDGALSLIDVKQQQRQLPPQGVRWTRPDFAAVAEGLGCRGFRARDEAGLRAALDAAFAHDGPSLVDVEVDPAGYMKQLQAMRG
jgi:acetolactate synthase-1/2/3 large subunit